MADTVADPVIKELPSEVPSSTAALASDCGSKPADSPTLSFKVQYGKDAADLKRPADSTVGELKADVEKTLGIPPAMQKLMFKGLLKDDGVTLQQVGIKNGSKVLLVGSRQADVALAKPKDASASAPKEWDAPTEKETVSAQQQHAKVLAKGLPEDALPGIKDRQMTLEQSGHKSLPGLLNSQGTKVRLTFRDDLGQLWIGSAVSTQKVPYASVSKIESFPIEDKPEYSILALHLGSGGSSKYWLYYVPSQYVAAVKVKLIGVIALI